MKQTFNDAMRHTGNFMALPKLLSVLCLIIFFFSSCTRQDLQTKTVGSSGDDLQFAADKKNNGQGNPVHRYDGLPTQTEKQLQQARAATARYRNIENARNDGYASINVVAPNMGHHFMKSSLLNDGFDVTSPEILVYNKNEAGNFELVAVEYAVHLTDPMPEGFFGTQDEWDGASGFPFWLLHAWVWTYNPDGVFNPTNPDVHVHD